MAFCAERCPGAPRAGRRYAADGWNRFDATIVGFSIIDVAAAAGERTYGLSLFRVLRVVRVVKPVNVNQGLKAPLRALVVSIPSLANVGSLLVLIVFVYAVMGANLYWVPSCSRAGIWNSRIFRIRCFH